MSESYIPDDKRLERIVFISIPDDTTREIGGFTLDPKRLIPVEVPLDRESFSVDELSWEMIVSAMLKILAYDRANKDADYYRNFILTVQPNIVAELTKTGIIKAEALEFDLATEIFLALFHLAPEEEKTGLNLAFVHEQRADRAREQNDFETEQKWAQLTSSIYQELTELFDDSADVHFYTANFYLKTNELSKALEYFELFLSLAPSDDPRIEEVAEVTSSIKAQDEDDQLFVKAYEQVTKGQEQQALSTIETYLEHQPKVWNAWFIKGWALRRLGEFEQAKKALETCLTLEKGTSDVYNEAAICCMETGDLKGARSHLQKALAIEPDSVKVISNMGVLELKNGQKEEARKYFLVAQELDPADQVTLEYLKGLE